MSQQSLLFFSVFLIAATLSSGCTADAPPKYTHEIVRTYAELLVFYEKQKMIGMIQDSLYERRVRDFFAERKIGEREFENQITRISRDGTTWRAFLIEATAAVDSIKSVKPS